MTFDYGVYLRECFSQPVLALLWTLAFLLYLLIPACIALLRLRRSTDRRAAGRLVLIIICILMIIGFPMHKQIGILVSTNGIAILQDRNAEPVAITGVIEAIRQPERNTDTQFVYDGEHRYGTWLTIGSTEYYAVTTGSLAVGDSVTLLYLPKSRCVLHIAPADTTIQED